MMFKNYPGSIYYLKEHCYESSKNRKDVIFKVNAHPIKSVGNSVLLRIGEAGSKTNPSAQDQKKECEEQSDTAGSSRIQA